MSKKVRMWILLAGLFIKQAAFAQVDSLSTKDLSELSLEQLMNIQVTTASKSNESVKEAPAIISVITAKEIELYGAVSLREILDRITSIYVVGTSFAPNGMVSIRGKQTDHYNTNILILLDGRAFRDSFHGGFNGVLYSTFPIGSIERIEVIRGPGSVLYGTNAYTGVINILTKKAGNAALQTSVRYGSFNTAQGQLSAGRQLGALNLSTHLNLLDSKGWDFTTRDEKSVVRNKANTQDSLLKDPQTVKYYEKGIGATVKMEFKGLFVNSFYGHNVMNSMGRTPVWTNPIEHLVTTNRFFADAGYRHDINKIWSAGLNVTYNHLNFTTSRPNYRDHLTKRMSNDVVIEWVNFIKPSSRMNIVVGGLTNTQTGKGTQAELSADGTEFNVESSVNPNPWYTVDSYNQTWYSAYTQADYTLSQRVKLIMGGQLNKITGLKADFVPRLGAVFALSQAVSTKLLYGQAFRSATGFELGAKSPPSVYGNTGLLPEKMTTFEGQVAFTRNKWELTATYFNNFERNLITRSATEENRVIIDYKGKMTSVQQYINRGEMTTQGLELEGKTNVNQHLTLLGSATYQTSVDDKNNKDIYGMPKIMAKLGATWNTRSGFSLGLFNAYFGKGGAITLYNPEGKPLTKNVNPEASAYTNVTANVGVDVNKVLKFSEKTPGISFNLYANNLLDEKIYYQEVVRRNINSLPGRPGRSVYFALNVRL
jgi:outer membrane receptor for ferrienterochelin and colicins